MATDPWAAFNPQSVTPATPLPSPPEKPKDPPAPKTTYRTLTPAEVVKRGLPPGKTYQESSEGKVDAITGAGEQPNDSKEVMRGANLESIIGQINRVQELYRSGIRDETLWNAFGALDAVGPAAGQFNAAGQAVADQGLAAFRVPGAGSQSDMEAKQFALANTPQAGDWDAAIEEKLRTMRARVDANRKAMGLPPAVWTGMDEAEPDKAVAAGATPPPGAPPPAGGPPSTPPPLSPSDPSYERATGDQRRVNDPETQAQVDAMLRQGKSYQEINAYAQSRGKAPMSPGEYEAVRKFLAKNPNYDGSLVDASKYEPISTYEKGITTLGDNAAGNYFLHAGQFLSGNTLDNLADDPERARLAMSIGDAQNPTAGAIGDVTGGVMGSLLGEAGLARLGLGGGVARGLAADIGTGAANGAGMADYSGTGTPSTLGDRMIGAGKGSVAAGVGNLLGSGVTKGVGAAISPTGGRLSELYKSGVRPSVGQRMAAAEGPISGPVGKVVNTAEEALQSVPIVGPLIRGTRQNARDQFQVGAFNQALAEIGEELPQGAKPGTSLHEVAQKAFNDAYDKARAGMMLATDEQLTNDLSALAPDIETLGPAMQKKLKAIMDNSVNNRLVDGQMDGEAFKKAISVLDKRIVSRRKSAIADDQDFADVLEGVKVALENAARRHSDPDAVALLDAADAGYAKLVRIEGASARAGGDAGTFSPKQFEREVQKQSGSVRSKSYLRGDALMQDYADAGKALEDNLPNSGTADRVMAGYAVGAPAAAGAVYASPASLAVLGAIGIANAPGVRKVTTGAMAPRKSATARAIADQLKKRARLVGAAGAASGVAALPGTSPAP